MLQVVGVPVHVGLVDHVQLLLASQAVDEVYVLHVVGVPVHVGLPDEDQ